MRSSASSTPRTARRGRSCSRARSRGSTSWARRRSATASFDYNARVSGLQALDRYTLRIRLKQPDYVFLYTMAHSPFGAVAREVVEAYGDDLMAHPVGTGPYVLKEWRRANKIILEANPDYRGFTWDYASSGSAWDDTLVAVDARQEDAADRPRRDQRDRGGAVALAGVQPEGARLPGPAGDVPAAGHRTPTGS